MALGLARARWQCGRWRAVRYPKTPRRSVGDEPRRPTKAAGDTRPVRRAITIRPFAARGPRRAPAAVRSVPPHLRVELLPRASDGQRRNSFATQPLPLVSRAKENPVVPPGASAHRLHFARARPLHTDWIGRTTL